VEGEESRGKTSRGQGEMFKRKVLGDDVENNRSPGEQLRFLESKEHRETGKNRQL